jgi:hypothetical protein
MPVAKSQNYNMRQSLVDEKDGRLTYLDFAIVGTT